MAGITIGLFILTDQKCEALSLNLVKHYLQIMDYELRPCLLKWLELSKKPLERD